MKKNIIIIFMVFYVSVCIGQSTITNTSQEPDENVNTADNITKINLFNIDFNGEKVPINLVYSHNGIKVNDTRSSLGLGWRIENIGEIKSIVNDIPDYSYSGYNSQGWFYSPNPDFSYYDYFDTCQSSCPNDFNYHVGDLSPDFFLCRTAKGINFDFLYKKNYPNNPLPVLMSSDVGVKINTNFSSFNDWSPTAGAVFNIIDNAGVNYDFIKGPLLFDLNRTSSSINRSNYYLKTMKNHNETDVMTIDYRMTEAWKEVFYGAGFNGQPNSSDYTNNIIPINNFQADYYYIDESRLDLLKITTTNTVIDFEYLQNGFLREINITDANGKYIMGYKFEYNFDSINNDLAQADLLWRIKKYGVDKNSSDIIYEFDYYYDYPSIEDYFGYTEGHYQDYFGYCNGIYNSNTFPYSIRNTDGSLRLAADLKPNINYAKQLSLKKIINKYGGVTEFDYQLNSENHSYFGYIYGGGILISSKKNIPNVGVGRYTTYSYEELSGYIIFPNSPFIHYISYANSRKFFGQIPELDIVNDYDEMSLFNIQKQGNFFKKVKEYNRDLDNMFNIIDVLEKEYEGDCSGFYRKPVLRKQTYYDAIGNIKKTVDYNYSFATIDTIDRATFKTEVRKSGNSMAYYKRKRNSPVFVNRIKLSERKEKIFNPEPIETVVSYNYINSSSSLLRDITQTTTDGLNSKASFFYSIDASMSSEPYVSELVNKNIVGVPLLEQRFKGARKLFEQKTEYAKDLTTSQLLLPKCVYSKKGDEPSNPFEKILTFDLYDEKENLLQFTPEKGIPTSTIWGYNKSLPIAVLQNVAYSAISPTTISSLQTKSNTDVDNCQLSSCTEQILRDELNTLRGSFPAAMITTTTYDPLIGETSITDEKGDRVIYEYDDYVRLKKIRDKNNNILSEKEYNHFTQN